MKREFPARSHGAQFDSSGVTPPPSRRRAARGVAPGLVLVGAVVAFSSPAAAMPSETAGAAALPAAAPSAPAAPATGGHEGHLPAAPATSTAPPEHEMTAQEHARMSGSPASPPPKHEMTAEEHARMSGNVPPSAPADGHGGHDTSPGESTGPAEHGTHDRNQPPTDRPRAAVLGGFGAVNAAILLGAGVARRRGGGNRRLRARAARSAAGRATR